MKDTSPRGWSSMVMMCYTIFFILTVPSGPPLMITARAQSSQSIIITWEPPSPEERNGLIVGYTINITGLDTGERYQQLSASNNLTIESLSPFSTYICVIAARTSVGIGPFSTVVTVQTLEDGVLSTNDPKITVVIACCSGILLLVLS